MSLRIAGTDKHGVLRDSACRALNYLSSPGAAKPDGRGPHMVSIHTTSIFARLQGRLPRRGNHPVLLHRLGQGMDG